MNEKRVAVIDEVGIPDPLRPPGEEPMVTICIQCSMRAMVDGVKMPTFDESPEEHARRVHPDPTVTRRERVELENKLAEKLRKE